MELSFLLAVLMTFISAWAVGSTSSSLSAFAITFPSLTITEPYGKPSFLAASMASCMNILGSQLLEDLAEFFLSFQTMYDGFVDRARAVERLLHDRRTTFVVVTTREAAPLHEAESFCEQLYVGGFHLGGLVLNKALPDYFLEPSADAAARMFVGDAAEVAESVTNAQENDMPEGRLEREGVARVLRTVGESFANFEVVAKREAELRAELSVAPEALITVPAFERDIHDLVGLARISAFLFPHKL